MYLDLVFGWWESVGKRRKNLGFAFVGRILNWVVGFYLVFEVLMVFVDLVFGP